MIEVAQTWADAEAARLNEHLRAGGVVQVATYYRATVYQQKHAGWFTSDGKSVYVKRGKSRDCLSCGDRYVCSVRTGHYV